tara:strand:- start:1157 stop:1951 length:795 start_codon:yes stop_codon:yes gene_type:complete
MENEKEVTASQEQQNAVTAEQEAIAEQVVEQVNQEVTEQVTEEVATENKPLTPEEVEKMVENATTKSLNSFKGSFANWTASQQKELKTQIDEVLDPLRKQAELIEESRLQEMSPEEQAAYYKSRLEDKQVVKEEPVASQEMDNSQSLIAEMTQGYLNDNNLALDIRDPQIWKGYYAGMSTSQALKLAEKNIKSITETNNVTESPPKKETPPVEAPPSTQGAPKAGSGRITSQTDLVELMANGQISATQFREAKRQIKTEGFANL